MAPPGLSGQKRQTDRERDSAATMTVTAVLTRGVKCWCPVADLSGSARCQVTVADGRTEACETFSRLFHSCRV